MTRSIQVLSALYFLEAKTGQTRHTRAKIAEMIAENSPGRIVTEDRIATAVKSAIKAGAVTAIAAQLELSDQGRRAVARAGRRPGIRPLAATMPGKALPCIQPDKIRARTAPPSLTEGPAETVAMRVATLRAICAIPGATASEIGRAVLPDHPVPRSACAQHIDTLALMGHATRTRVMAPKGHQVWNMHPTEDGIAAPAEIDAQSEAAA